MEQNQNEEYKVLLEGGIGEIVEKKSRFIATVRPVNSEAEATAFIEEMKKKYWDARHNCSAFVIGSRAELTRCSDDGEPSGTAGRPMLEALLGTGIRNICVVVTRYFGGVLLGTGGLVRAYTQAVKQGIEECKVGTMRYGCRYQLQIEYTEVGKVQYILAKPGIVTEETNYTERVEMYFFVPSEQMGKIEKELTEATSGKLSLNKVEKCYTCVVE